MCVYVHLLLILWLPCGVA